LSTTSGDLNLLVHVVGFTRFGLELLPERVSTY